MDWKKEIENCWSRHSNFSTAYTYIIVFLCKWEVEEHCNALIQTQLLLLQSTASTPTERGELCYSSSLPRTLPPTSVTLLAQSKWCLCYEPIRHSQTLPTPPTVASVHIQLHDPNPTVSLDILTATSLFQGTRTKLDFKLISQSKGFNRAKWNSKNISFWITNPAVSLCDCPCFHT